MKVCPPKAPVSERDLISNEEAGEIADVFQILSNCTRLRILHAIIKAVEINVTQLAESTELKTQAISNQLRRLLDRGVVESRRDGVQIFYSISMKCVVDLLERGICISEEVDES